MSSWDEDEEQAIAEKVERFEPLPDGIHKNVAFAHYLKEDRVSKSRLWKAYNFSPAHARIEEEANDAMRKGSITHTCVLEPDSFRLRYVRGPDDRKGNKWKDAVAGAADRGMEALTSKEFDNALLLRDAVKDDPYIKMLAGNGAFREISAFATDPATGLRIKARADAYVPGDGIIVELKTTTDARASQFGRRVLDLGYHVGEAHYRHTWSLAGGDPIAFIFIALETDPPYAFKIYELKPDEVAEGEAIRAKAMATWAECVETGVWPAYATQPEPLGFRSKYDFKETVPIEERT